MFASPLRAVRWTLVAVVIALVCAPSALASAQLQQTKTVTDVNGGGVRPGDVLTYDITGTNTGPDAALNVVVGDDVPANTTYVNGSANANAGGGVAGSGTFIPANA